jgi:hypothetical protein
MSMDNFVVLDSVYGKFIVARTCMFQAEALVKTGRTHIESELANIFAIVDTLPTDAVMIKNWEILETLSGETLAL